MPKTPNLAKMASPSNPLRFAEKLGWSRETISDDLESFSKNAKSGENTKTSMMPKNGKAAENGKPDTLF